MEYYNHFSISEIIRFNVLISQDFIIVICVMSRSEVCMNEL